MEPLNQPLYTPVAEREGAKRPSGAACAKRPHGRLRRLFAELENVGEASDFLERRAHGRVPAAFWKNPEKIWLNLANIQQNSGKINLRNFGKKPQQQIQQSLPKILRLESGPKELQLPMSFPWPVFPGLDQDLFLPMVFLVFWDPIPKRCSGPGYFPPMVFLVFWDSIPKRCKGVHCVDLGESFPTSIYLQNLASIQPRTSLVKFARSPRTDPPGARAS